MNAKNILGIVLVILCSYHCSNSNEATDPSITPNLIATGSAVEGLVKISPSLRGLVGQTQTSTLTSLQYFVRSIELCQNMTIMGSGYSNAEGCITIYQTPDIAEVESVDFYNAYTVTDALLDSDPDRYIDFLSESGRARLATPTTLTTDFVGTYRYGKIDYFRPIKIQAEFKDSGGASIFYTKTPETSQVIDAGLDSGGRQLETVQLNDTTTGPAELMTYMLNNGGTWFSFLQPFEITAEDIANNENIQIDFVFNPNAFASAYTQPGCAGPFSQAVTDTTNCVFFDLPYAKLSPVPRRSGETTMKEVYLVDYVTAGASAAKLRVELYYNGEDSARSIQGVDIAVVSATGATEHPVNIIQAYQVEETAGVVTFYGYNSLTGQIDAQTLTGLTRRADGNLTLRCWFAGAFCGSSDGTQSETRSYTYEGQATL